jgi:hypothetical protein
MLDCWFLVLLLLVASVLGLSPGDIGDVTIPASGCQLCASTGECSRAFRDGPGQYCGDWADGSNHELPCCCPLNAVCNVSPADYVCTCAYIGAMPPYHGESELMNKVLWLWWILGMLAVVAICGVCGYVIVKRMAGNGDGSCAFASPEIIVPLVSPSRESLYGSTGLPEAEGRGGVVGPSMGAGLGAAAGLLGGVSRSRPATQPVDLDVGGDGFDGGLGSLEKVEEADELQEDETSDDVEAEEEIALLTVPGKE